MRGRARAFLFCTALASCAPTVEHPLPPAPPAPADFPTVAYARAAARGEPVYRIDSARSLAVVRVYRAGPLARLGHDHVVASRAIHGYAALAPAAPRADLYVPLARLTVDEPALRAAAGFGTQPSPRDIEGTRTNMLEKVLEVERFPFAVLRVERRPDSPALDVSATIHGVTRRISIPVETGLPSRSLLYVRGEFSLKQTEFGIEPFSALGGALRVADRVDVMFEVYARRVSTENLGGE